MFYNLSAQHSTAQHSTAQHSTAQHSTAQHSTAQHSTAQQAVIFRAFWHTSKCPVKKGVFCLSAPSFIKTSKRGEEK
ncbi:adenine methyltransferase [Lactococcus petauri]|uniref:adenine methyltransferase n=1 Tax=Lactococcus petauri TaxID=1940789 RepID=UPI003857B788